MAKVPPKESKPKSDSPKESKPKSDSPKESKPKSDSPKESKPKSDSPKESKPKSDSPKESDVPSDKNFKKFIQIQKSTGKLPDDFTIESAMESEQTRIVAEFNAWVNAGMPKPEMAPLKVEQKKILAVYRKKHFGNDKLYYKVAGEDTPVGIKSTLTYKLVSDPDNPSRTIEDKSAPISTAKDYTINYSEALAKELVKRCIAESPEPAFYFVDGAAKYTVTDPDNFTGKFDDLIKDARKQLVI